MAHDDAVWSAIRRLEAREAIRDLPSCSCFIQDGGHAAVAAYLHELWMRFGSGLAPG